MASDFNKRLRKLLQTLSETEDWGDLSVEDAIGIVMAGIIYQRASEKFPDLFSDLYTRL